MAGWKQKADEALKGLLGDFPQGFNAGATAGVPGWAGDMAYMLDMGKRGLLGEPGINPKDFPGTTDYIASKAGYPVPESLSGQLGAAVGGLLSPGPGDLARFAPVLAAIPFWHGSPHKFDTVDLSRIGTGEGAQAYGWGFYGADAQDVAESYMKAGESSVLVNGKSLADRKKFQRLPDESKLNVELILRDVADGTISKSDLFGMAAEMKGDYGTAYRMIRNGETVAYARPNLYRGEYVWPDPAKEAATPLTPEDLLQWDRPLSEQPQIAARLQPESMGLRFRQLDNGYMAFVNEQNRPIGQMQKGGDEASFRARWAASMNRGTGAEMYKALGLTEKEASEALRSAGIPGIRYLDGASRSDGQGTYNTVMFDQEGINLLERNGQALEAFKAKRAGKAKPYKEFVAPADERLETARKNAVEMLGLPEENTAMDRARAMGFVDAYHGTTGDVEHFDPAMRGAATGAPSAQKADFLASQPKVAVGYSLLGDGREATRLTREIEAAEKARDFDKSEQLTQELESIVYGARNEANRVSDARFAAEQTFNEVLQKYGVQQDFFSESPRYGDDPSYEIAHRRRVRDNAYNAAVKKIPLNVDTNELFRQFDEANGGSVLNYETAEDFQKIAERIAKKDKRLGELYLAMFDQDIADTMPELQRNAVAMDELEKAYRGLLSLDAEYFATEFPSGANVMPLMVRPDGFAVKDMQFSRYRDESYNDLIKQAAKKKQPGVWIKNTYDPGNRRYDVDTDVFAVRDPSHIRSRFAAFDPARINDNDLLASLAALGIGLTAYELNQLKEANEPRI